MSEQTLLTEWVAAISRALTAAGIEEVVVAPGSRSTPLALAVARQPHLKLRLHLDERSAGFFALGLARGSGRCVALICTSGTAAANLLPAVAEADLSRVPLLLLTADRPHELRDVGAPQTIDQVRLFGGMVRWFSDLPEPTAGLEPYLLSVMARAVAAAGGEKPGPVQLNLPFREPLLPQREQFAALLQQPAAQRTVNAGRRMLAGSTIAELAAELAELPHGLIVVGPDAPAGLAPFVTTLARRLRYPILADPLSGLRFGAPDPDMVVSTYDAFLRDEAFLRRYPAQVVLRFGAMPTAKPFLQYLQRYPQTEQIIVDGGAGWREPTSLAQRHVHCDEAWFCAALSDALSDTQRPGATLWLRSWLAADAATRAAFRAHFTAEPQLSEPAVFDVLGSALPAGATLFVGNSMPIRDADSFLSARRAPLACYGNRGANGIDGLVSTALGLAAAGRTPLTAVLGDISLFHDSNGLLAARAFNLAANLVLINNDGGGIFSFLPQAAEQDQFERLFGTPHGLNFAGLAALHHAEFLPVETRDQLAAAVAVEASGLRVIEVRSDRAANVGDHRRIWPRVSAALSAQGITDVL
jgi:2-succinyl-5-enolpyruvyl-6-hydroxy-3-cyclohexene-1-carboxylate synthase